MADAGAYEDRIEGMAEAMGGDPAETQVMVDLSHPKTPFEYLRLFFTGFAMGASDVVPGVSGGTMAFILGVYETLINAIKSFNIEAIQLLLGRKFGELVDHISLRFLIALGAGLATAVLLLAGLLENLLQTQPSLVFSFFAGLIVASVVAIGAKVQWNMRALLALIIGTVAAFLIVGLPSLGEQLGHSAPVLFISGAIAICAMILPGISGSFILLILGQYEFALGAVKSFDIVSIIALGAGAVVGILSFSRILSWLLKNYENATVASLVGFMIGSLRLIIHRAMYPITEEGEAIAIEFTPELIAGVGILALIGFVLVSVLDHLQSRSNPILRPFWK